jgi:hypothetical protein
MILKHIPCLIAELCIARDSLSVFHRHQYDSRCWRFSVAAIWIGEQEEWIVPAAGRTHVLVSIGEFVRFQTVAWVLYVPGLYFSAAGYSTVYIADIFNKSQSW